MEHQIRSISIETDVELYQWGEPIGRFTTKEIGFNSINVFTGKARIDKHLVVEMFFVLKASTSTPFRMKGLVTYQAAETARIVFFHYYPNYFKVLSRLISRIREKEIVLPYPTLEPAITTSAPPVLSSTVTAPRFKPFAARPGSRNPGRIRVPVPHS